MSNLSTSLFAIGALALLAIIMTLPADAYRVTILPFDPTPADPTNGDDCSIFLEGEESDQGMRDMTEVAEAFRKAKRNSDDMRTKLTDVCAKHGHQLIIRVSRNNPGVMIGNADVPRWLVNIDLGDIEQIKTHLIGKDRDKETLGSSFLIDVLAHEIDHQRTAPGDDHRDPVTPPHNPATETGPAVDDANTVHGDLGQPVHRNFYADATGTEFTVNGQMVRLNGTSLVIALTAAGHYLNTTVSVIDPETILSIPKLCDNEDSQSCYPSLAQNEEDVDLDGISDLADNCQDLFNPQQTDMDSDSVGQGCDDDDDGDGVANLLEASMGSTDMNAQSTPEHWSNVETCEDGIDNDLDGFIDLSDQSCFLPNEKTIKFQKLPKTGSIYPLSNRMDLGGVYHGFEILPITMTLNLDYDGDVKSDDKLNAKGVLVISRNNPSIDELSKNKVMKIDVLGVFLKGTSDKLGEFEIRETLSDSLGKSETFQPGKDLPANLEINFPIAVSFGDGSFKSQPIKFIGSIAKWPPFGESLSQLDSAIILQPEVSQSNGQISGSTIDIESISSHDYDKKFLRENIPAPIKQIAREIPPESILCKPGFELLVRATSSPICVRESTVNLLLDRNAAILPN